MHSSNNSTCPAWFIRFHVAIHGPDREPERDQRQTTLLLIKLRRGLPKEFLSISPFVESSYLYLFDFACFSHHVRPPSPKDLERAMQNEIRWGGVANQLREARADGFFAVFLQSHRRVGIFRGNIRENCFTLKSFTRLRRKLVH